MKIHIGDNVELMSSVRNGVFGGSSSLLAAAVTIDFHAWIEPLLLGVVATLLTTTLSFFWKHVLKKWFPFQKDEE